MNLIKPSDPLYFTQTSEEPYDRHRYKVVDAKGDFVIVDGWEEARHLWWNTPSQFLSHVEVLDKIDKKAKGFK